MYILGDSLLSMLSVYYGCMFAGKTTALLREVRGSKSYIVIKHLLDGEGEIVSHRGEKCAAKAVASLMELEEVLYKDVDDIFIDEGQFFEDIVEFCLKIRSMYPSKRIVVAGVDYTYRREPFGHMPALLEMAQEKHLLHAQCSCGSPARYTARKEEEIAQEDKQKIIIVGNMYYPVCGDCFISSL